MPVSKTCGPDDVTGIIILLIVIKPFSNSNILTKTLTEIFNYYLRIATILYDNIPKIWEVAKVKPLCKKGDRHNT